MAQVPPTEPSWLDWIAPLAAVFGIIQGGVVWIVRKIILDFIDQRLNAKHLQNSTKLDNINKRLKLQAKRMRKLINDVEDLKTVHNKDRRWTDHKPDPPEEGG